MKTRIVPTIILLLVLFFVFFGIYMKFYNVERTIANNKIEIYETSCGRYNKQKVIIDQHILLLDVADDYCKKDLGLSGRTIFKEGEGMIFVFEKTGNYSFWMKDMIFPLDILWVDDNSVIVGIEKAVLPSTYPKTFGSNYKSKYVLEITSGYSDKYNIKVGNKIIFSEK